MKAIPKAIGQRPACQRRRSPPLSSRLRSSTTTIAMKTSVQMTASHAGRMFVAPGAALIDMPPTAVIE